MAFVNAAKDRLKSGRPIIGMSVAFPSPAIVEMSGYCGFHFVTIDCEHSPMDVAMAEHMVRAAEAAGVTPFARPSINQPHEVLRLLDAGVLGLVVPRIETRMDAEHAARAARYYPEGERGNAGGRWARYGLAGPMTELVKRENESVFLMALVESATGVENIEEIVAVPGIDAVYIGPSDLCQSLGLPGQSGHPLVREHIDRAIEKTLAASKYVGFTVTDAVSARRMLDRGVQILNFAASQVFVSAGKTLLDALGT